MTSSRSRSSRRVEDYAGLDARQAPEGLGAARIDCLTSLREAISAFVLICAARQARGQVNEHNSMLVHVTRFQDVQKRVADQISEHLRLLQSRIRYGDDTAPVDEELRGLWEEDFVPTSARFPADQVPFVSWTDSLGACLGCRSRRSRCESCNGTSRDALQYYEHRHDGLSVIAIGGNKLSRGLTLEGLSVSYYTRDIQDVRHAAADGTLVRLPPVLRGPVPPVHYPGAAEGLSSRSLRPTTSCGASSRRWQR